MDSQRKKSYQQRFRAFLSPDLRCAVLYQKFMTKIKCTRQQCVQGHKPDEVVYEKPSSLSRLFADEDVSRSVIAETEDQ